MHFLRLFLALFRNYFYYHFISPKINKRGVRIRAGGGLENFPKINKRRGTIVRYSRVPCIAKSTTKHRRYGLAKPRSGAHLKPEIL